MLKQLNLTTSKSA